MREGESPDKRELLEQIDILVDGRYIKDLHDSLLQFRGSSNQYLRDTLRVGSWRDATSVCKFPFTTYTDERTTGLPSSLKYLSSHMP